MVNSSMHQLQNKFSELTKPAFLWWSLVIMGTILRVRQYFSGRSFWADEASLAFNIAHRTFVGLTQPLDYEQGAPIGFLFIEKILVISFGNIDQVMRLVPLFAGVLSVYLMYRIAQVHITGGMFATLLFAISWPLIYYSSEMKQYSSDVMIGILLVFLASHCLQADVHSRDFLILGVAGMVAVWLSHPSVFILAGIGLALFLTAITRTRPVPISWLVGLGAMWLLSFGVEYFVSLRHLLANDYLYDYWKKAFMPLPPGGTRIWLTKTYYSMLLIALNRTDHILAVLIPILVVLGCLSLLYREWVIGIIVISPFFIALFASAAQKYPLKDRFMLFLVPFLLFLIAEGLGRIYLTAAKLHIGLACVAYILPAFILFYLTASVSFDLFLSPYYVAETKPVMKYVGEHRHNSETIYVYHSSESAFNYYAPFYDIDHQNVLIGYDTPIKRVALQGFFDDIEKLRGHNRVWFIFSDIVDCGGCGGDMQLFYVNYLNDRGTMLDRVNAAGANAYLYNLNP